MEVVGAVWRARDPVQAYVLLYRWACDLCPRQVLNSLDSRGGRAAERSAYEDCIAGFIYDEADPMDALHHGLRTPPQPDLLPAHLAGLLRALDEWMRDRADWLRHRRVELPTDLGGGAAVLLAPAPQGMAELVPLGDRIQRSGSDRRASVAAELGLWWTLLTHGAPGEEVVPVIRDLDPVVDAQLARVLRRQQLRLAASGPAAGAHYLVGTPRGDQPVGPRGVPFRFLGLHSASREELGEELDALLAALAEHQPDILVLPELCLDGPARQGLVRRLRSARGHRPALVVAGSFHEEAGARPVNRAVVLDGWGRRLWIQDKCTAWRATPGTPLEPAVQRHGGYEDIRLATEVQIHEGLSVRLAVLVCLDAFEEGAVGRLAARAGLSLLLVPAASTRLEPFEERARRLGAQSRTITLVSNSAWLLARLGRSPEDSRHGMVVLPEERSRGAMRAPDLNAGPLLRTWVLGLPGE